MRYLTLATMAAAAALCAAPVLAQSVLEEVTVTSRGLKEDQQSKSRPVSFADLDLTKKGDRQKLGLRIADTANDLCEELNQPPPQPATLGQSCKEIAVQDALGQVRTAVAAARGAAYAKANLADGWNTAASADASSTPAAATETASAPTPEATLTIETITNGPIPDTKANRARFGQPLSLAGKRTAPAGN